MHAFSLEIQENARISKDLTRQGNFLVYDFTDDVNEVAVKKCVIRA